MTEETPRLPDLLPVLPLKDAVLYPYIIVPLSIGRESSILARTRLSTGSSLRSRKPASNALLTLLLRLPIVLIT